MNNTRKEFYFPLKREQLLENPAEDKFYIEDKIFIDESNQEEKVKDCKNEIENELENDILKIYDDQTFTNFYSLLSSFPILKDNYRYEITKLLSKYLSKFVKKLEDFFDESSINQQTSINPRRNSLKIFLFFAEWNIESILLKIKGQQKEIKKGRRRKQNKNDGGTDSNISDDASSMSVNNKKKTKKKKTNLPEENDGENLDYNSLIEEILGTLNLLSNMNIKILFRNKIIEDDLISLIIKICFDSLEIATETKNLTNKEAIFTLLQTVISKFQSNTNIQIVLLKLTTKIVNLIYSQEPLVSPLSEFIILAIKGDNSLSKMAVDIIHEVSKTVFEDNSMDSQGLKNVAKFLVILSEKSSKTIYNNITSLISLFDSESYVIRNALVEIICNVIINILCQLDDITDVETRNNYLKTKEKFIDILFDRLMDKSSFCRAKVLSIFEKLCDNNTISIPNYLRLLRETRERLCDVKTNVRKRAISLVGKIISMYAIIFKCDKFLSYDEITQIICASDTKIREMEEKLKNIDQKIISLQPQILKNNKNNDENNNNNPINLEEEEEENEDENSKNENKKENNNNDDDIKMEDAANSSKENKEKNDDVSMDNSNNNRNDNILSPSKKNANNNNGLNSIELSNLTSEKQLLIENLNKENMVIDYFQNYKTVLKEIDKIVPLITQLLGSKNAGDVNESIDLFILLHKLRISSANLGVKKMLSLIIKPEESIKKRVIDAYKELFFNNKQSNDISAAYIINLASSLNFSEFTCFTVLLKSLLTNKQIDLNIFLEIWKILLKNPEIELPKIKALSNEELKSKLKQIELESITALKIINEAANYEPKILLNNSDLYIKNVLTHLNKKRLNWLIIKYSLQGLQKIHPLKKDTTESCLLKIVKSILHGYGKDDINWFIACKEMINTIFQIIPNPEKICQYLIIKLSKLYFINNENNSDQEVQNKFLTQNILSQASQVNSLMNIDKEESEKLEEKKPNTVPPINSIQNNNNNCNTSFLSKDNECITPMKLSQLIFVVGHVALNMVIYAEKLESSIKSKFVEKKKNSPSKSRKGTPGKSKDEMDEINEISGGKEAEMDYNVSLCHKLIDENILNKHLLSKYTKLIIDVAHQTLECSNSEMKNNILLYKSAILALCKLMCINAKFCEDNLPFMFKILSSDIIDDSLKLNVCCAFGDFINRFPNIMQKEINNFFECLHSKSSEVRRYAMIVISHLVLGDMLKLKGEVVDICLLLQGEDEKLKQLVKLFFHEVHTKGNNVIYNIIPKALARLSQDCNAKKITYTEYKIVVDELMKYVEKDKHTEGLIDKLFVKIKNSHEIIDWQITTYCLSLLNYNNEKNIAKFIEMYSEIKDRNDEDQIVKENLEIIFQKFKKLNNLSLNLKNAIDDAEKKILAGQKIHFNKEKMTKKRRGRTHKDIDKIMENGSNNAISIDSNSYDDVSSRQDKQSKSSARLNNVDDDSGDMSDGSKNRKNTKRKKQKTNTKNTKKNNKYKKTIKKRIQKNKSDDEYDDEDEEDDEKIILEEDDDFIDDSDLE